MFTMNDVKELTEKLMEHFESSVCVNIEVWRYNYKDGTDIKWAVYISQNRDAHSFNSFTALKAWADDILNPPNDELEVE